MRFLVGASLAVALSILGVIFGANPMCRADEVHLRGGRVITGKVVERSDDSIIIKQRLGEVRVDPSDVLRIIERDEVESAVPAPPEPTAGADDDADEPSDDADEGDAPDDLSRDLARTVKRWYAARNRLVCSTCEGTGLVACPPCRGTGQVAVMGEIPERWVGRVRYPATTGVVGSTTCPSCKGERRAACSRACVSGLSRTWMDKVFWESMSPALRKEIAGVYSSPDGYLASVRADDHPYRAPVRFVELGDIADVDDGDLPTVICTTSVRAGGKTFDEQTAWKHTDGTWRLLPHAFRPAPPVREASGAAGGGFATGGGGGTVRVKGYTRKDGTYVRAHTRRNPR